MDLIWKIITWKDKIKIHNLAYKYKYKYKYKRFIAIQSGTMTVNNNIKWQFVAVVLGICVCFIDECSGHGILMKPPSRSSVWRFSKFKSFHVPENYDDNALFCGGATRLHKNGGKCGPCGDAYGNWNHLPKARKYVII